MLQVNCLNSFGCHVVYNPDHLVSIFGSTLGLLELYGSRQIESACTPPLMSKLDSVVLRYGYVDDVAYINHAQIIQDDLILFIRRGTPGTPPCFNNFEGIETRVFRCANTHENCFCCNPPQDEEGNEVDTILFSVSSPPKHRTLV